MDRGRKKHAPKKETPVKYSGQIINLDRLSDLPKKTYYVERSSLGDLLDACVKKYAKYPKAVYKFDREMGSLWLVDIRIFDDDNFN